MYFTVVMVVAIIILIREAGVVPVVVGVSGTGSVVHVSDGIVGSMRHLWVLVHIVGVIRFRVGRARNVAGTVILHSAVAGSRTEIGH